MLVIQSVANWGWEVGVERKGEEDGNMGDQDGQVGDRMEGRAMREIS